MVNNYFRNSRTVSSYTKAEIQFITYLQEYRIPYLSQVDINLPLQPEEERQRHIVPDFKVGNLLIFIDGDIHEKLKVYDKDIETDKILVEQMNYKVLRLHNNEILNKNCKLFVMDKVWAKILQKV